MEDKNNNYIENRKNKKENNIPFSDYMKNDNDILPILNESMANQKQFISYIIFELKKNVGKSKKKISIKTPKKILSFLIDNYKALGIAFFSLLIKENEFSKDLIIELFYENILKNEIISLIQKIIDIFNFDFEEKEISNPIEEYYRDLINCGIIEEKELTKNEKRLSLTEEEQIFIQLESILFGLKRYRKIGNNVENDASEFFDEEIKLCEDNLNTFKSNKIFSNASLEFYLEKIEEIKDFKSKVPDNEEEEENNDYQNLENINDDEEKNNIDNDNNNDNIENINNNDNNEIKKINNNDNDEIKNINYNDDIEIKNINNNEIKNINYNDNEIKTNFIYDDEEDEEKINTTEKIINDIKNLRKKPLKDRIYFYKEENLIAEENQFNEFKKYYFPLNENKKNELAKLFCSFLNFKGGRLYIGISDDKRCVKGVVVNNDISYYEKTIKDLVKNFYPKINADDYLKFYAIPVKNNKTGKKIPNLIVFKIIIKKGDPSILYSISKEGLISTMRLQGQCANLTAEEIHKEIIERNKYKKNQKPKIKEDDDEMNDPKPQTPLIILDYKQNKNFFKKNYNNKIKNIFNKEQNYQINKNNDINKNNEINKKNDYYNNEININKNDNINNNNENLENIIGKEKEDNFNEYMNNKTKKKKNKKKYKNEIYRVEISNIDKNVDEKILNECFGAFNCQNLKIYKQQNGLSNGFMDFMNEENALNCIKTYNNVFIENKKIQLKMVEI